jgi:pyruvate formate lyase activating enzyme
MKGLIFSVKRYSIHDGPGIRVTFFMKGCPLRCPWCHNPEGISPFPAVVTRTDRIGKREFHINEEVGRYYTVEDILEVLEKEKIFIGESKGGVTFSGGEPLLQHDFLLEALEACKSKGIHTAVDTSGFTQRENLEKVLEFTDLFLFDIKLINQSRHTEITGVSNATILDNYIFLLKNTREIHVRIPIIPGYNEDEENIVGIRDFLLKTQTKSLKKINLLPFHKTGSSKYKRFDIPHMMKGIEPPSEMRMHEIKETFRSIGVKVKIGG